MKKILEMNMPLRTVSEANILCHWAERKKRKDKQRHVLEVFWDTSTKKIPLPCKVKLTRIAPRFLDTDNLASSFKFVRDKISELIKPGLAPGQADKKDILFEYDQKKSAPKEYGIKIEIFT